VAALGTVTLCERLSMSSSLPSRTALPVVALVGEAVQQGEGDAVALLLGQVLLDLDDGVLVGAVEVEKRFSWKYSTKNSRPTAGQ
jgi:hypothetical protein